MAKKKETLTLEEKLEKALVPEGEQPYKVPDNWCWVYTKMLASICTGKRDANFGSEDGRYPFFTCASQPIRAHECSFDCSAIILAGNGDIGNISFYTGEFEAYQRTYVVEPLSAICAQYLYHWFRLHWVDYNSDKMYGTAIPYVRMGNLQMFPAPLPPISEQHRIVARIESLFSKLDEAKELAQSALDSFETRKAAILHQAFTGELTKRWREVHGVGMESWAKNCLKNICKISSGGTPSRSVADYYTGKILWVKTGEIFWNEIYDSEEKITEAAVSDSSAKLFPANTIVVAMYGMGVTRGRAGILKVPATTNQAVCALIPYDTLLSKFLFYYFMCNYEKLRGLSVGGNQLNLSGKIISSLEIYLPTLPEQTEIVRILDSIFAKETQAKELTNVIAQIDLMKKAILARAFRGELGTNVAEEESAVGLLREILGAKL